MTPKDSARERALALFVPNATPDELRRATMLYDLAYSDGRLSGVLACGELIRPKLERLDNVVNMPAVRSS